MKFGVFLPNKPPPATYASVKEAIVHHFTKLKQHDIAESLENLVVKQLEKPIRVMSTKKDEKEAKIEQDGLNVEYNGELDDYRKRKKEKEIR
jgi:HEPN domain-containing protein